MRLINVNSMLLEEFYGDDIPPYAILSHTWGREEVSYQDWQNPQVASSKAGFDKIEGACKKAQSHSLDYLWVDTNCIDKTSSAELSEAINSMYQWYARSKICYAYLSDVVDDRSISQFWKSRWFTRGWTLQELLAPRELTFYAVDWSKIGSRGGTLVTDVALVTGISEDILTHPDLAITASVGRRMSWLAERSTTRVEDLAYCMLGLFDVNMPLLYGEGMKAFTRLQEEIIKVTNDQTIFCWSWTQSVPDDWASLLAPSPNTFCHAGNFVSIDDMHQDSIFAMTNVGLSIRLPVIDTGKQFYYFLKMNVIMNPEASSLDRRMPCIPVTSLAIGRNRENGNLYLRRTSYPPHPVPLNPHFFRGLVAEPLFVRATRLKPESPHTYISFDNASFADVNRSAYGMLPLFDQRISFKISTYNESGEITDLDVWSRTEHESSILRLTPLTQQTSAKIGCALLCLRARECSSFIFLGIRVTGRLVEWFCQVFTAKDHSQDQVLNGKYVIESLVHQVEGAKVEQTANFNEQLNVSVVFGDEIFPSEYVKVRTLNICNGVVHRPSDRLKSYWVESSGEESGGSDVDSNVVAIGDVHGLSWARSKGQFRVEGFL